MPPQCRQCRHTMPPCRHNAVRQCRHAARQCRHAATMPPSHLAALLTLPSPPPPLIRVTGFAFISPVACYFRWSHNRLRTHMLRKHCKTSIFKVASATLKTLIKPVKNEHFRWSVFGKGAPCPDCSRCRCVRHRAPRATRCGNAYFRSNAIVAPSGRLRRLTGRLYHKYHAKAAGLPCFGRYESFCYFRQSISSAV